MAKIKWVKDTRQYANGDLGYVGKYHFFSCFWDGVSGSKSNKPYIVTTKLPGLVNKLGKFETKAKAFEFAVDALSIWMKNVNMDSKSG